METPVIAVAKSKKLIPMILGGVAFLSAIGAYFYFKKPKVVAGTGAAPGTGLPNKTAIKTASAPATFLITNGKKYAVKSGAEFKTLTGHDTWDYTIKVVSQAVLDGYPDATAYV